MNCGMTTEASVPKVTTVFTPLVTHVCKGVAILLVLFHHLLYNSNPALYSESLHVFALKCKFGVAVFLMLSGAGITFSRCTWKKTYAYRIPRMLLNYWFVGFVFILIGMKFFGMTFEAAYPNGKGWTFLLQLFGVNWITSCEGFNPTWWFMDAIIPLYLVAPVFYLIVKWNPIVVILVAFVTSLFPWDFHWWLIPFAFGMATAAMNSFEHFAGKKNAIIGLILCSILLFVSFSYHDQISHYFMLAFFLIAVICCLRVMGGRASGFIFSPLAFIGRHSMNIFLLHTFFLIWYGSFFTKTSPWATYPILLSASLSCSIIIEKIKSLTRFDKIIEPLKGFAA
jgi:peptidoglycan/LPS O-acetylase OafA/YrhL